MQEQQQKEVNQYLFREHYQTYKGLQCAELRIDIYITSNWKENQFLRFTPEQVETKVRGPQMDQTLKPWPIYHQIIDFLNIVATCSETEDWLV